MINEDRIKKIAYEWGDDDYPIEDVINAIKQAIKEDRETRDSQAYAVLMRRWRQKLRRSRVKAAKLQEIVDAR